MPEPSSDWFDSTPLLVLTLLILGLMAAAFFGGRLLQSSFRRRPDEEQKTSRDYEGYIVSSVLGLLALLLGFTFSLSISRYEERRELVISQANAIETTYLRAQFLDAPHRERLSHMLAVYTDNLIDLMRVDPNRVPELLAKDRGLVTDIWAATVAGDESVRTLPLFLAMANSVNTLIDLDASRRESRLIRIPSAVFVILLIYHVGAAGVLGYVLPVGEGRFAGAFVLFLMSLAFLLIIDIDRPAAGWVRTDPLPLLQVREFIRSQPPTVFDRWRK